MFVWILLTCVIIKGVEGTHSISRIPTYVIKPKPTEISNPAQQLHRRRTYNNVQIPTTTQRPLNQRNYAGALAAVSRTSRFKPNNDNRLRMQARQRAATTPKPTAAQLGGGIALEPWFRSADPPNTRSNTARVSDAWQSGGYEGAWHKTRPQAENAVLQESFMLQPTKQTKASTTNSFTGLFGGTGANSGITALYSFDSNHGHGTAAAPISPRTASPARPVSKRFRVLPNGSIVDYGRNAKSPRRVVHRTQPKPTHTPRMTTGRLGVVTTRKAAASSTAAQVRPRPTDPVAGGLAVAGFTTGADGMGFAVNGFDATFAASPSAASQVQPTAETNFRPTQQTGWQRPVDDRVSRRRTQNFKAQSRVDDPGYWAVQKPGTMKRIEYNFDSSALSSGNFSLGHMKIQEPTTTTIETTTTVPTTTTTTPTTTTTTTTTPAPTTTPSTPKPSIWGFQAGEPIEITYLNDTHVCPNSRARWQDYTVYLETKPRLCMIQISWNARYKQEPIYHRSWWGVDVEWVYKTVYDPEVKFVDLHGRRGGYFG